MGGGNEWQKKQLKGKAHWETGSPGFRAVKWLREEGALDRQNWPPSITSNLSHKNGASYSCTISWLRTRISVDILRSVRTCVRGSRIPFQKNGDFLDDFSRNAMNADIFKFSFYNGFFNGGFIVHRVLFLAHTKAMLMYATGSRDAPTHTQWVESLQISSTPITRSPQFKINGKLMGQSHELRMRGPKLSPSKILQNISRLTRRKKDGGCKWLDTMAVNRGTRVTKNNFWFETVQTTVV